MGEAIGRVSRDAAGCEALITDEAGRARPAPRERQPTTHCSGQTAPPGGGTGKCSRCLAPVPGWSRLLPPSGTDPEGRFGLSARKPRDSTGTAFFCPAKRGPGIAARRRPPVRANPTPEWKLSTNNPCPTHGPRKTAMQGAGGTFCEKMFPKPLEIRRCSDPTISRTDARNVKDTLFGGKGCFCA